MLNIFYGRESIDKEKFIYEKIGEKGGRTIVIVPDQYTLEAEKQAFRYLKTKGLLDVEIISMSRLGYHLFEEQGGNRDRTFVDKYGRHMLLMQIAEEKDDELTVFKGSVKKNNFIELMNNFISEMKQYNITPEILLKNAEGLEEENLLGRKLHDMYTIYSEYEKRINGKYTDTEDYIDLYKSKIRTSEWIKANSVWVYGFDSFAPKALDILGELMSVTDVNVFLTYDTNCFDSELFDLTGIVMKKLLKEADERGIKAESAAVSDEYALQNRSAGIAALERQLYSVVPEPQDNPSGIILLEAANIYNEAESAASYILYLLREKGYRYRDIVVICNDQEVRASVIGRVFEEYGINLFNDRKRSILSGTIAIYVTSLIDITAGKFRTSDIFKMLKTGFSEFTNEEIEILENYTIKYRIRGNMWKKPFEKGAFEYSMEELEAINSTRERLVSRLLELEEICKTSENIKEFIQKYYEFVVEKLDLPEKIRGLIDIQQENGFMDFAEETAQTWNMIVGIFDQISEIAGEEKFDAEEFSKLLVSGLSELQIGILPPTSDDILMGTMQRTRAGDVKAVIVIGANEGLLPMAPASGGIFTLEELDQLAEDGTELCKVDSVREMEEKLAIYRNLTKPSEHLFISYAKGDAEGEAIRPSEIIDTVKKIFPTLNVTKDIINMDEESFKIGGRVNTLRHLTTELQKVKKGEKISGLWKPVIDWFRSNDPESLAKIEAGLNFTNVQKNIPKSVAEKLYQKRMEDDALVSPSQVEKFSRCPFSHFITYGLKPQELRIFEAGSREIGDVYHQCLMKTARYISDKGLWETITDDELKLLIKVILEQDFASYRDGVFSYTPEEEYKMKRVKDTCFYVCKGMVEQVRTGAIEESFFEIGFGKGRSIKPVEIDLGDKTVYIEGKIDRCDMLKDDRVKIIDYKTGNEKFNITEAEKGYRLQLMIYLKAAMGKERKPAGVFYFLIDDPQFDLTTVEKNKQQEKISSEMKKFFKLNGIMVNDDAVIKGIAGDFDRFSEVVPLQKTKEGIKGTSADVLLSEEEFADLQSAVDEQLVKICRDLTNGVISIHPKKSGDTSPCAYCQLRSICRFDTRYPGCNYDIIR